MKYLLISAFTAKVIMILIGVVAAAVILYFVFCFIYALYLEHKMYRDLEKEMYVPVNDIFAELSGKYNFKYVPIHDNWTKVLKNNRVLNIYPKSKEWDEQGTHKFGTYSNLETLIKDLLWKN